MMKEIALKIAALFSFCGGPLFISDLLKPRLGVGKAFVIVMLPVMLMVIGAVCLDDTRNRWSIAAVRAGRLGLFIALGMHVYALWCFAHGTRVAEMYLYYFGIAVGVTWSITYLRAERRWASSDGDPSDARDPAFKDPIEPA